ncbi:hypothetical protein NUU61_009257 [Penicillium alfredii]|uniref:Rhodanese domain-containing protein n=1 Tax=Penicillium alfredii TaxID=1506179 RepID=A0A9W9EMR2_9EURO|nr:uncharacterized protein NUU61_009257 [Penicillium alfredii]KAJ5084678.1 hypothetical protein NUU61_009257 [Penicillium alfredii]
MWRSTLALSTVRVPARQTASFAPAFARSSLSATSRTFSGYTQTPRLISSACTISRQQPATQPQTRVSSQLRRKSDDAGAGSLRQWGFEDITSALPTDPNTPSPTHKPLILIDVREPAELTSTGIIPSALCIPLASQPDAFYLTPDEFETRFGFPKPEVAADGNIVFYCKAGVRARAAAQLAVQAGYEPEKLGVYDGSWLDWERRGGRTEKWEGYDW